MEKEANTKVAQEAVVITGTIKGYWYDPFFHCYCGRIYGDSRNRFPDGTIIHTSKIMKDIDENNILVTRGSIYLMLEPLPVELDRIKTTRG